MRISRTPPGWSPSSRRAWVEMVCLGLISSLCLVALLAEGVGRNTWEEYSYLFSRVALLAEGVGRNRKAPAPRS